MTHSLPVEYLSNNEIQSRAKHFLDRHHPAGGIPIPIEEIIELQLKWDIIPVPGLRNAHGTEGFITSDMTEIYVDQGIQERVLVRYRFTLAHEMGHAVLHQKVYRKLGIEDTASWLRTQHDVTVQDHDWLERQANAFAGFVLVPTEPLLFAYERKVSEARARGLAISLSKPETLHVVAGAIAREFDVSTPVLERRMRFEYDLDPPPTTYIT